jgi:UDPglucose 6-dehydrogenase
VPVGTAKRLAEELARTAPARVGAELAWNPEFLREGFAVADTLRPDRLVVGARSEAAVAVLREVYAEQIDAGVPFLATDYATAELVKVAANAFLATKISFINAMAEVCEAAGADVTALADALGHDPRIGRRFLNAGLGFGGGCLPKDIRAFMARAGELGAAEALMFLREVDAINLRRRSRTVELARELCGGSVVGEHIAILGAAFKPDSDDVRDSPALNVAGQIHLQGGQVTVYDPKGMDNARSRFPTLTYADSAVAACAGANLVLHLTEWQEFRALDPAALTDVVGRPVVLDARNALDADAWRAAGWTYRGFGRS